MDKYSDEQILKMVNHINGVARESLNWQTPCKMASLLMDKKLISLIGLKEIHADEVMLKPALLKRP